MFPVLDPKERKDRILNERLSKLERERKLGFLPFIARVAQPASATGTLAHATAGRGIAVVRFTIGLFVSTTNDGTHYWTVKLQTVDGNTATDIPGASVSMAGQAPDSWTVATVQASALIDASVDVLYLLATKVNSPGDLFWSAPLVEYL